jgi:hypothetical protein
MPKTTGPARARLTAARKHLPLAYLRSTARDLLAAGKGVDEVAKEIADLVDRLIDFRKRLPPPAGWIAEAADGPLAYAIALPLVRAADRAIRKATEG